MLLSSMLYLSVAAAGSIVADLDVAQAGKQDIAAYKTSGGTGTGVVLDNRSHILTSYHVVEGCSRVMLRHGNLVLRARQGRFDDRLDLAILIPERSFPAVPAQFRKAPPKTGEAVVVAGFPKEVVGKGLLKAVSAEIVSIKVQTPHAGMMRLSQGLNRGASGGPVLDSSGRVIGILAGILVNSRSGIAVESQGIAIRGEVVQEFLRRTGIDFREGRERPANLSSIARQAASQVVKIECSGRRH